MGVGFIDSIFNFASGVLVATPAADGTTEAKKEVAKKDNTKDSYEPYRRYNNNPKINKFLADFIAYPDRRSSILYELMEDHGKEAIPPIIAFLKDNKSNLNDKIALIRSFPVTKPEITKSLLVQVFNDKDIDPNVRAEALLSRSNMGTKEAIPILIQALQDPNKPVLLAAINTINEMKIDELTPELINKAIPKVINALTDPDEDTRELAITVLGKLGSDKSASRQTQVIVPKLINLLRDSDENAKQLAASALARIGSSGSKQAILGLTSALQNPNEETRTIAASNLASVSLNKISKDDPEFVKKTVTELVDALKDPSKKVRIRAAESLGQIGSRDYSSPFIEEITTGLSNRLGDSSKDVKLATIEALHKIWRAKDKNEIPNINDLIIPSLIKIAREDRNKEVKKKALEAISVIGENKKADTYTITIAIALIEALKDPDPEIRRIAARGLGKVGSNQLASSFKNHIIPKLASVIESDNNMEVKNEAAIALVKLGSDEGLSHLMKILEDTSDKNPELKRSALSSLAKLKGEDATKDIIKYGLGSKNSDVRFEAVYILGRMKPTNEIISALINALDDRDRFVQDRARDRLVDIGPAAVPFIIPELNKGLNRIQLLAQMGEDAVDTLLNALDDENSTLYKYTAPKVSGENDVRRANAMLALGRISRKLDKDNQSVLAIDFCNLLLRDPNYNVRENIIQALEGLDSSITIPIVNHLRLALIDKNNALYKFIAPGVSGENDLRRVHAILALGKISSRLGTNGIVDKGHQTAIASLLCFDFLLCDPRTDVRITAIEALGSFRPTVALHFLEHAKDKQTNEEVKAAIQKAINKLQEKEKTKSK